MALLNPGETGRASFVFKSIDLFSSGSLREPVITLDFDVSGVRIDSPETTGDIFATLPRRSVEIATDVLLGSRMLHFSGPFVNSGPMPPQADKETTYTVIWSVTNSTNDVLNMSVSTVLPSYVTWLDNVEPVGEDVSFDTDTGRVLWNIGTVSAGTGYNNQAREVAFQISLLPSLSQVDKSPTVVRESSLSGTDKFTNTPVSDNKPKLTTRLPSDPQVTNAQGVVVE